MRLQTKQTRIIFDQTIVLQSVQEPDKDEESLRHKSVVYQITIEFEGWVITDRRKTVGVERQRHTQQIINERKQLLPVTK